MLSISVGLPKRAILSEYRVRVSKSPQKHALAFHTIAGGTCCVNSSTPVQACAIARSSRVERARASCRFGLKKLFCV